MSYTTWVKGNDLQNWANELQARQKLPALVRRLIHATIENPVLTQFPADEGTQRKGWDGVLQVEVGNAWVPSEFSVWEMGVDKVPSTKAEEDYQKRTDNPGSVDIGNTTFVFVTPRKWEGKTKWCEEKRAEGKWRTVVAWDCDDMEQWLEMAPPVDAWLARMLGKFPTGVRDISSYWAALSTTSNPALTSAIFLAGREKAKKDFGHALAGPPAEIPVSALSLQELRDFTAAIVAEGDDELSDASAARVLIVESRDAWNQLTTSKNRMVLIPGDQLQLDKAMVAEAVNGKHHVVTQVGYTYLRNGVGVRLPRADRWELKSAMEASGFDEERADRLAREAGGCLLVLIRLASTIAANITPEWAKSDQALPLLPLVLLGEWADKSTEDRKLVEKITGKSYAEIQQLATRWMNVPDAPLQFLEGIYSFISREDSWRLLSPFFTRDLLDLSGQIALEVLGEDDPRFEMPAEERYLAGFSKKLTKYSGHIRKGIAETLALLGACGANTPQGSPEGSSWRAAVTVRQLLDNASAQRWFSLAYLFPLLAEAGPEEFLTALEDDLRKDTPAIKSLFENNADGLFSSSPHTNLMWALENLAWDVSNLSRVVLILAALIELDSGGRMNPRPAGVLHGIFRFWLPQTAANIEERLQVLELLVKRKPAIAWSLLKELTPERQEVASPASKPRWRHYDTSQSKEITYGDIDLQKDWAAKQLIQLASTDTSRWRLMLKEFVRLPELAQQKTLQWLVTVDPSSFDDDTRMEMWNELRRLVQQHRFFHDAFWALPPSKVDDLEIIQNKFAPSNPVIRSSWLFGFSGNDAFGNMETPHEEREQMEESARIKALQEIFETQGLAGVVELVAGVSAPGVVGMLVAKTNLIPDWSEILPDMLTNSDDAARNFALSYGSKRINTEGDSFVDTMPIEDWAPETVAEFALAMHCERKTWEVLRQRKPEAEEIYWKKAHPWGGNITLDELEEALKCLLQAGRPVVALDVISSVIHGEGKPRWDLAADILDAASLKSADESNDAPMNQHSVWQLCELAKYLQNEPDIDGDRLALLEWRLLPLARHQGFIPKTLHDEMSKKATFFAEVIKVQFRAKDEPRDENANVDPHQQAICESAYNLLDSWYGIPGTRPDGTIDFVVLRNWVEEVRQLCRANKRIEVCDVKLGEQFAYSPADEDGKWPCEPVREIFEVVTSDEILRGFEVGVSNRRGVVTKGMRDGGEQERDLAKKYSDYANRVKIVWPRIASALRRLSEKYEQQANSEDERVEGRD